MKLPFLGLKGYGPRHSQPKGYRRINKLNRSKKWRRATNYQDARNKSSDPDKPVK